MLVYGMVLVCAATLGVLVYRYDLYEKEPPLLAAGAVGLGFVAMWLCGAAENELLRAFHVGRGQPVAMAGLVAIVEDAAKLLTVMLIARLLRGHFNDPLDGIIYGTLVGLGAGFEESLLYLQFLPATMTTLGGEVIRLVAHALMGGLLGFAVGIAAHPQRSRRPAPGMLAGCVSLSLAFHFAWDYIAYQPQHDLSTRLMLMGLMLGLLLTWGLLVAAAWRRSRLVFEIVDAPVQPVE